MPKKAKVSVDPDAVVLVKELPPQAKSQGRKGEWLHRFEETMAKPKQWHRIRVMRNSKVAQNMVSNFNRGKVKLPEGVFETAWRPEELTAEGLPKPGCKGLVFARYMGPGAKRAAGPVKRSSSHQKPFRTWLAQFKNDKAGHLGQLARYVDDDPTWPTRGAGVAKVEYLAKHIKATLGAKIGYEVDWLEHSWEDYEKYLKGEPIGA